MSLCACLANYVIYFTVVLAIGNYEIQRNFMNLAGLAHLRQVFSRIDWVTIFADLKMQHDTVSLGITQ